MARLNLDRLTLSDAIWALAYLDNVQRFPDVPSRNWDLIHKGRRYCPKEVAGAACFKVLGRIPDIHTEFPDGDQPGSAVSVLRNLGFTIERKRAEPPPTKAGKDWSNEEVRLIVADYFEMLEAEILERPYKKAEHRKALIGQLSGRSDGSVEFKHQNISAVLIEHGLPYINGYKPRGNYQSLLAEEVGQFLDEHPDFLERLASAPSLNPTDTIPIVPSDFSNVIEQPPEKVVAPNVTSKPWLSRKARKTDFAERDARNRQLGSLGESFVFELERHRLNELGRDDLAQKVQWVAQDIGDGLGFDILSFDEEDDSERMLEVKTTGLGKFFPFYLTSNELRCSEDIPDQFHLYRVFEFGRKPRIYILKGSMSDKCDLDPVVYRALIG